MIMGSPQGKIKCHNKIKLIDNFEKTTFYDMAKQKFKICQWAPGGSPREKYNERCKIEMYQKHVHNVY